MSKKIFVVIPARNEEDSIAGVIGKIKSVNRKHKLGQMTVLIVNDSTDNTGKAAKKAGAIVINGDGKGLGAAMYKGLRESARLGADIIVSIDADGQFLPEEMEKVVKPILENKADLVLGSRFLEKNLVEFGMSPSHKFGNSVLSAMVRFITGLEITDAQTGYRAMKREVAERLEMLGSHTYVQETIIDAAEKNFRIIEVPVKFVKREHGGSKVVSSIKRYAIWTLPTLVLRAGVHMMLFVTLGLLMTLMGVALGLYLLISENFDFVRLYSRIPSLLLVVLLVFSGLLMFFFGFTINLIISIKNRVDK